MSGSSLAPRPPQHLGLRATLGAIFGFGVAYAVGFDGPTCVASASLAAVSVRIALIDLKLRIIQDRDILVLLVTGSAWVIWSSFDPAADLVLALFRSTAFSAIFQTIRILYINIRGREGLGFGDVKLVAAAGPILLIDNFGLSILISSVAGMMYLYLRKHLKRRSHSRSKHIPFGCFLIIFIYMIWFATEVFNHIA